MAYLLRILIILSYLTPVLAPVAALAKQTVKTVNISTDDEGRQEVTERRERVVDKQTNSNDKNSNDKALNDKIEENTAIERRNNKKTKKKNY